MRREVEGVEKDEMVKAEAEIRPRSMESGLRNPGSPDPPRPLSPFENSQKRQNDQPSRLCGLLQPTVSD